MSDQDTEISLNDMLKGQVRMKSEVVAESNKRITAIMKEVVRDFQKKEKISLEKASQIVLNA